MIQVNPVKITWIPVFEEDGCRFLFIGFVAEERPELKPEIESEQLPMAA